jgi:hypothetical protein
MSETIRSISYGGGVQSSALVVLAAQGVIDYPLALFANVGDRSEHPATLSYVRDVMIPWAAERGVEVVELRKRRKDGTVEDLWDRMTRDGSKSVPIPMRLSGGVPTSRACTAEFKIRVVEKELRRRGATKDERATVAIGISTDEVQRLNSRNTSPYEDVEYPLIDLRLDRSACQQIIRDAGLPVPPKSACFFCPWHSKQAWREMRRDEPELFDKSVELERHVNSVQVAIGNKPMYLSDWLRPLDDAVTEAQTPLFHDGPEGCDEGYCWT